MLIGSMTATAKLPDGLRYVCVAARGKVKWKLDARQLSMRPEEVKLLGPDKSEYPMVGSIYNGMLSLQPIGLSLWRSGKASEVDFMIEPVFAVPEKITAATLVLGKAATLDLKVVVAPTAAKPVYGLKVTVLKASESDAILFSEYPGFQKKPVYSITMQPISGSWTKVTVEFQSLAAAESKTTTKAMFSHLGLLQELGGKRVYTACAGRTWVKGISMMPEHIPAGGKRTVDLYFAVPALGTSAQLLYHGQPLATVTFAKK